ncbi:MAG: dockerin type I repeat-containing protein [Planctomycetota bacterium]
MRRLASLSGASPLVAVHALFGFCLCLSATGVSAQNPAYTFTVRGGSGSQGGCTEVVVTLDSATGGNVDGWQMSVCHNPTQLSLIEVEEGAAVAAVLGAQPPFFSAVMIHPGEGWLSGLVLDAFSPIALPPGNGHELHVATYEVLAPAGAVAPLSLCGLSSPPINAGVSVGGVQIVPVRIDGEVLVMGSAAGCETPFVRADANDDGTINVADAVYVLATLFGSGPVSSCQKAADANDDGTINIADPVFGLTYLFQTGPNPAPPFPACGSDPTADALSCDSAACP